MKNKTSAFLLIYMIITALLGATSCYRSGHTEQQLLMMDTLSDENPDTVLAMLDCMDFNAMSKSERMHAELLRGKAMNKAYVNFTTDSVMLEVVDWYERHGNANQKMLAYYVLGCAFAPIINPGDAMPADSLVHTFSNITFSQIKMNWGWGETSSDGWFTPTDNWVVANGYYNYHRDKKIIYDFKVIGS